MTEAATKRSLERGPGLVKAGEYHRQVRSDLERVWENVHDWEHLPWVHSESFERIERIDSGRWGWHVHVGFPGGAEAEIELCVDTPRSRYVARTLSGAGAGGEIWTTLTPISEETTQVDVEFWLPAPGGEAPPEHVGEAYRALYERLWDQDERMMRERSRALVWRRRPKEKNAPSVTILGPLEDLRRRMPLIASHGGACWRVLELEGDLLAHGVECPHLLGPLGEVPTVDGEIECPWHGYRFDVRSGRSSDGRGLRLPPPPRVEIDVVSGQVMLVSDEAVAPGE